MYNTLHTEKKGHTFIITINRPKVLNSLNTEVFTELSDAISTLKSDPELKGAYITGQGDKAFVAGADIGEFTTLSSEEASELSRRGQQIFFDIEQCPKPIIAAVNGFALGGGCELAMACHMRVGSRNAKFGLPEVKLGLLPGYGGTQRLAQLIGKGKAIELMITGDMISADTAYRLGLVNYVTTRGELREKCEEILEKAYKQSPKAIELAMGALNAGYNARNGYSSKNGYEVEAESFGQAMVSDDGKEGVAAFLEKRKANFTGK
ncbi:MAG: enoyl-CoA hydratase-related protein [Bacteroidota bacterium]